jgi:hypothetical protein
MKSESHVSPCPSCGYCPTCGRKNAAPSWPWFQGPYWVSPYWHWYSTNPSTVTVTGTTPTITQGSGSATVTHTGYTGGSL